MRRNRIIQSNHLRKHWQMRIKTHFDQAGKKITRRRLRKEKAAKVAPRPTGLLRPVVNCPTFKYNYKTRFGRGFTAEELKAVGVPVKAALKIGIAVDYRRTNTSNEALQRNVARLQEFLQRVVVKPGKSGKQATAFGCKLPVTTDAAKFEQVKAGLKSGDLKKGYNMKDLFPVRKAGKAGKAATGNVKNLLEASNVYERLQEARKQLKNVGKVEKEAAE